METNTTLAPAISNSTLTDIHLPSDAFAAQTMQFDAALLQAISDLGGGVIVTEGRRIVYANEAFARLVGYTPAEICALPSYLELVVPVEREAVLARARQFRRTGDHYETTLLHREGCPIAVEVSTKPLDTPAARSIALVRDIRQRQQREQELRQWRARVTNILESIADAFFIVDRDYRYIYLNTQAEQLAGRKAADLIGRLMWAEYPQSEGEWRPHFERAWTTGQPVHVEQRSAISGRWIEAHIYPGAEGLSVYCRDVSERKQAEQLLQQRNRELETINAVVSAIHHASELRAGIQAALESVVALGEVDGAECLLYAPGGQVDLAVSHGLDEQLTQAARGLSEHASIAALAFKHDAPVYVPDIAAEPAFRRRELASAQGYRSLLALPITGRNTRLGILILYCRQAREFSRPLQSLLMTLGVQLGMAIERARLYETTHAKSGELLRYSTLLMTLNRIALKFDSTEGTQHLFEALGQALGGQQYRCALMLYEPAEQAFIFRYTNLHAHARELVERTFNVRLTELRIRADAQPILYSVLDQRIPHIISNLPQRAAVWLRRAEQHTVQRVFNIVGITPKTIITVLPLLTKGQLFGTLVLWGLRADKSSLPALGIFANEFSVAFQNARLVEELRAARIRLLHLTQQLISAQEEERKRISRELHDEAGQAMTALKINLKLLQTSVPEGEERFRRELQDLLELTDATMEQLRTLAHDLRPPALDTLGLDATLRSYCAEFAKRTQLSVDYQGEELPDLPAEHSVTLYRLVQEALTNVAKHAQARQVSVQLSHDQQHVRLRIADDGVGFQRPLGAARTSTGIGLLGMRERLEMLGGALEIASAPGQGTQLCATVPWREAE